MTRRAYTDSAFPAELRLEAGFRSDRPVTVLFSRLAALLRPIRLNDSEREGTQGLTGAVAGREGVRGISSIGLGRVMPAVKGRAGKGGKEGESGSSIPEDWEWRDPSADKIRTSRSSAAAPKAVSVFGEVDSSSVSALLPFMFGACKGAWGFGV
jgi:hypothetical protein